MIPPLPTLVKDCRPIPGWLETIDVAVLWACGQAQHALGVGGDILEIGTYLGKSAVVLGSLLSPGEYLTVCDIFQDVGQSGPAGRDEWLTHYASLRREDFERNYRHVHQRPPIVRQMSSADLRKVERPHSFRLLHVDGSHLYSQVKLDVQLAIDLAGDRSIIVFDDISRPSAPGVAAAVWPAVESRSLLPVAVTRNKLYTMPCPDEPLERELIAQLGRLRGLRLQRQEIGGRWISVVEDANDVEIWSGKRRTTRHLLRRWIPPGLADILRPLPRLGQRR